MSHVNQISDKIDFRVIQVLIHLKKSINVMVKGKIFNFNAPNYILAENHTPRGALALLDNSPRRMLSISRN